MPTGRSGAAVILCIILLSCGVVLLRHHRDREVDPVRAAVRSYLEAWIDGDYRKMYPLLSQQTQQAMTETEFVSRYEQNSRMFARPLHILSIDVISRDSQSGVAQVRYALETQITAARASELRRAGDLTARPGLHRSVSRRMLVLQHGQWKLYILPSAAGGGLAATRAEAHS